jgi:hypothetical protein
MPMSIRSRIVGVSALAHYIVNVSSIVLYHDLVNPTLTNFCSYRSRAERLRKHQTELLLRIRRVLPSLFGSDLLLFPVSTLVDE